VTTWAPGVVVAERYRLARRIGAGGMGEVWAGEHVLTGRKVAIKVLFGTVDPGSHAHQRFVQEARAATEIAHPAVVEVLDAFVDDGAPVLVMELCEGETLGERLRREGALPPREVVAIMIPIVGAVAAAHARSIAHRDLKPDNVFLARVDGAVHPKVLDFGLAKLLGERASGAGMVTQVGTVLGTPSYMAPEQARGDTRADHRVDVWALGVIFYRCLSGVLPIEGSTVAEVLMRVADAAITPLEVIAPELPAPLTAVVGRMLCRDPAGRPSDLGEVLALLEALDLGGGALAPTIAQAPAPAPRRPATTRRWALAGGIAAAALAALALARWARREPAREAGATIAAEGRPPELRPQGPAGAWIWRGPAGNWLFRATSRRARHYQATLRPVGGEIVRAAPQELEDDDTLAREPTLVTLSLRTARDVDGVDLTLSEGCLELDVRIDGAVHLEHVYIGQRMHHPTENPFTLCPEGVSAPSGQGGADR
jgi:serine/threonine-protein kinase